MIDQKIALQLHEKSSLGEQLSASEEALLLAWYAEQDSEETFSTPASHLAASPDFLQQKIEAALKQLVELSNQIQQVFEHNEQLRTENIGLQYQIAQQTGRKSA